MLKLQYEYDYDDVTIVPNNQIESSIESRKNVDLNVKFKFGNKEKIVNVIPIFVAPMINVGACDTLCAVYQYTGIMGVYNRFQHSFQQDMLNMVSFMAQCNNFRKAEESILAISVGTKDYKEKIDFISQKLSKVTHLNLNLLICIDLANGHTTLINPVLDYIKTNLINNKEFNWSVDIMSGNVVTDNAFKYLLEKDVNYVRIGIGGGSMCSTGSKTGIYRPAIDSINDCANVLDKNPLMKGYVVADGGLHNSERVMKAFSAGANFVMMGYFFSPYLIRMVRNANGEWCFSNENITNVYKDFAGSASKYTASLINKTNPIEEGVKIEVKAKNYSQFTNDFNDFLDSMRSCLSYCGMDKMNWQHFRENSTLTLVTNNVINMKNQKSS